MRVTDGIRRPSNFPPLPVVSDNNNSIATHDMQIDIESFIKHDLINLNQNERKLQEELRDLYIGNKGDLKEIY